MTAKNPQKQGRILEGGGYFNGWPEYIPLSFLETYFPSDPHVRRVGPWRRLAGWSFIIIRSLEGREFTQSS